MKITKLGNGNVEIILENDKEVQAMVIRHYAGVDVIISAIKSIKEPIIDDNGRKFLNKLIADYDSYPGEDRVHNYVAFCEILGIDEDKFYSEL